MVAPRRRSAPLCQGAAVLVAGFGLVEEVVVEAGAGVENFDADETAVFPVQRDEPAGAGRHGGLDGGAGRRGRGTGEVDVDRGSGGGGGGAPHSVWARPSA